ncbi:MAG: flavin reductase family protein [Kiritimatiellae bacterium]|nr:flavin reductase family protein [Kiritimatiellia bacterium]
MQKNLGKIAGVWPMPVLMIATYDEDGTVNVMNAAWGQVCDTDKLILILDGTHKTVANIRRRKAFTVALADWRHLAEADYFGTVSGNQVPDKFAMTGLVARKSEFVDAPVVEAFPFVMECELAEELPSIEGFVGRIVNAAADESVLDENGKVDPAKLGAIAFDPFRHGYYAIGEKVGRAWHDGRKFIR